MADAPSNSTIPPVVGADAPAALLRGVSKHFGRFAALTNITAEFAPGRLYVILGGNGAGKSTMLRALAGLMRPTRGEVEWFGHCDVAAARHRMGYMAHPSLLYDELSALENLQYFAQLYGMGADKHTTSLCRASLHMVGLDPDLRRSVGQYSQGMKQRASLARALVHDPELLLLDEPFSNVDTQAAERMVALLAQMRDAGKTIFVVTHQLPLLAELGNEFIWMASGQILVRKTDATPPRIVNCRVVP